MSEPDVSALLTVAQAIAILDAAPVSPRIIRASLLEANGLRLAEDLSADRDYPPFDKSLMDGYAVRTADVAGAPVELELAGEIAAGATPMQALAAGQTHAIMTGAPLPPGADGVVPIEETTRAGDTVRILRADHPGRYISRRGADIAAGKPVLARGTLMHAPQIAAAATIGAAQMLCYARPRVAILSTGDELVPASQTPAGAQVRNANGPMLVALLMRWGCHVVDYGIAADKPEEIRAAIREGLKSDALFITGGMSMGAYDYVPGILKEMGVELKITKLRIKPGKPFVFGVAGKEGGSGFRIQGSGERSEKCEGSLSVVSGPLSIASVGPSSSTDSEQRTTDNGQRTSPNSQPATRTMPVFGFPGNPVSTFVCAVRLASRVLQRLAGAPAPVERWTSATLAGPLGANGPREFYQPVRLDRSTIPPAAHPLNWKGSADVFTLALADGLLARPENDLARAAGSSIEVLEF